jgi:hypothetical protein
MTSVATPVVDVPARAAETSARPAVPWRTVMPVALVLAFADGFWAISLRGAVGAIQRTQSPFSTWWQESTLLLPLFALGVLTALVLAARWFGPSPHGARAVLATSLLVAVGATLVGIGVVAISAAVDYRLQIAHVAMMMTMGARCVSGDCVGRGEDATLALQVQAVGVASALLLATNIVLVLWVLAFQGGRWNLGGQSRRLSAGRRWSRAPRPVRVRTRLEAVRIWMAAGLLGAAVIHVSVVPEHLREWPAAGVFFVALALAEVVAAGQVLDRPVRTAAAIAAVMSAVPLAVWLWSRTVGMPFGPEPGVAEAIGLADTASCLLEAATLAVALVLARRARQLDRPSHSRNARRLALLMVAAVTVVGVGSGLGVFGDSGPGDGAGHHAEG